MDGCCFHKFAILFFILFNNFSLFAIHIFFSTRIYFWYSTPVFSSSSADKGANILTALAASDEFADDTGKYFDNDIKDGAHGDARGEFGQPHADALNKETIAELEAQTQTVLQSISA